MRIPNINNDINVAPVAEFHGLKLKVEQAKTYKQFAEYAIAAKTYLQCLIQTNYITKREHYEYQCQLNDVYDRKESEVKNEHS